MTVGPYIVPTRKAAARRDVCSKSNYLCKSTVLIDASRSYPFNVPGYSHWLKYGMGLQRGNTKNQARQKRGCMFENELMLDFHATRPQCKIERYNHLRNSKKFDCFITLI